MKMYCWSYPGSFLAVAHAESIDNARKLVLTEIGTPDGSSQHTVRARAQVNRDNPQVWMGPNVEFVLTDSALLEESDNENARLQRALKDICRIASERAADGASLRSMIEILRICEECGAKPKR